MSTVAPRVSVGLAVFNGERYLEQAINSILGQTFTDFELIISDNASTDNTESICRNYSDKDSRIRYYRNTTNIGGANNENQTFRLARGEFFRWAAHDDICAPELIEKCVQVLDRMPSVVLCYSKIMTIDEHDRHLYILDQDYASSTVPRKRFCYLTRIEHGCEATYGLIRVKILQKTDLQLNYSDSDRTLLAELGLHGRFYQIPEVLFFKRIHPEMSTEVYPDTRERMTWFGEEFSGRIVYPHWLQFFHYLRIIARSPILLSEKFFCYIHMIRWIFQYRRWRSLGKDIILLGKRFFFAN